MFKFFRNQECTEEKGKLLQEMQNLNGSVLVLLEQIDQIRSQQSNQKGIEKNDGLLQAVTQLNKNIGYLYLQNEKLLQEMQKLNAKKGNDDLLREMQKLNESVLALLAQNQQLWRQQNNGQKSEQKEMDGDDAGESGQADGSKKEYTSYEKGKMSKPKDFFDSPPERILESYLDNICSRYDLGRNFSIRILVHQPLGNYTKETKIIQVNRRNKEMHFDFLIEARKWKWGKGFSNMAGHFPLLAIELNGGTHDEPEQMERDEYKRGACEELKIPLIVIRYEEGHFTQEDIEKRYLAEIMTSVFVSIFHLFLKNEDVNQYSKLLEQEKNNILQKYSPIEKFPAIDRYVQVAYTYVCNENGLSV